MYSIPDELDYSFNSFTQESVVLQQENITHNASSYSCITVDILYGSDVLPNVLSDINMEHFHSLINKSIASPSSNRTSAPELVTLQKLKVDNSDDYLDNHINTLHASLENKDVLEDFNVNEHNISQDNLIGSDSYFTKTLFSFPFFNEAYEILSTLNSLLKAYDPLPSFPFPVVAAQRGMRPISTPPPRPPSSGTFGRQFNAANNFPSFTANNNVPRASNDNFPGFSSRGNYGNPHPMPNAMSNSYNNPSTIPNSYTPTSTPTTYHYGTNGYSASPNSLGSSYASPPSPVSTPSQSSSSSYNKPSIVDVPPVHISPQPDIKIPMSSNPPPLDIKIPSMSISSISSPSIEPLKPIDTSWMNTDHGHFDVIWPEPKPTIEDFSYLFYVSDEERDKCLPPVSPGNHRYFILIKSEIAQDLKQIKSYLSTIRKIALSNRIVIDYNYLNSILKVNIEVLKNALNNGFIFETLASRYSHRLSSDFVFRNINEKLNTEQKPSAYFQEENILSPTNILKYHFDTEYLNFLQRKATQKVTKLLQSVKTISRNAASKGILDITYLRQVLSVNIDVAINALESGFVLETMLSQSHLYTNSYSKTETHSKTFDKNSGNSGGDGGNRTNTGNSADIDIVHQALESKDVGKIATALKQVFGWNINIDALNKTPKELYNYPINLADSAPKFPGIKFSNTKNNHIRIMKGRPDGHPSQQQDYIKIVSNGKPLGRNGKPMEEPEYDKPSIHPFSHIPLNEWINWNTWNTK